MNYVTPKIGIFIFLIKCLVFPVTYADALLMATLVVAYGIKSHFEDKEKQKDSDTVRKEIQDVKNAVSAIKLGQGVNNGKPKKLF